MAAESDTDTDQKGRAFTADDIVHRDDYKCQQCGYVGDESDKMYAHYLSGDHTDPSNYECQCGSCVDEDDQSRSLTEQANRLFRYFWLSPLAALLTAAYSFPFYGLLRIWLYPETYNVPFRTALVFLMMIPIMTPIYIQLVIWLEPRNGAWFWGRVGSRAVAGVKRRMIP